MKVTIRDRESLCGIRPLEVIIYLKDRGWKEIQKREYSSLFLKEGVRGESFELVLPIDLRSPDFATRMAELLQILETEEGRSQLDIFEDLSLAGADVIRPKLRGLGAGRPLSLDASRMTHEFCRDMMLAAACSAIKPKPFFSKNKPRQALAYLNHARFGDSRNGYLASIISPVLPKLKDGTDSTDTASEEPFERKTVRVLAQAIDALSHASREAASTQDLAAFRVAVERGVSSNLCDALIGLNLATGDFGLDFRFSWSPARGVPLGIHSDCAVSGDSIPILKEVSNLFKERESEDGIEILGVVQKLEHQGTSGRVTICGTVDGNTRTVAMELEEADHRLAVRSYQDRIPLICTGELTKEGNSWTLRNPRQLELAID